MKTILTSLLSVCILPNALSAQPTLTENEFYRTGEVVEMANCNTINVHAGASGENITWDFSGLSQNGTSRTTYMTNSSSIFLTSNLLAMLPDGRRMHLHENSSDTYLNGIEDTVTNKVIYYDYFNTSKRPVHYLDSYIDTYQVTIPVTSTYGTGYNTTTADAYGTLVLPTGNYTNVMRIRKNWNEQDTTGSSIISTTTTMYQWFDENHAAPLFELDSTIGSLGMTVKAMYLLPSVGVSSVSDFGGGFTGYLHNNELTISGALETGKVYEVVLYNLIGGKMFTGIFTARSNIHVFQVEKSLIPGIYIVDISSKDDASARAAIRVIKQ
jgi:hypothetical protein